MLPIPIRPRLNQANEPTGDSSITPPMEIVRGVQSATDGGQNFPNFLANALKRHRMAADAESNMRIEALDDFRFYDGEQWSVDIRSDRALAGRPCLTIDKLKPATRQILNQQLQSRPAIQVNPVGSGSDVDTAEVLEGLIRHIEVQSQAEIAYGSAFKSVVIGGFGYFRILTRYARDGSFNNQDIVISRILDPFTVYFDPTCKEPDYSDAEFAFIVEDLTPDQFRARYPKAQVAGLSEVRSIGDAEREWFLGGKIRIAEYFWIETRETRLVSLTNGDGVLEDEITEDMDIALDAHGDPITRPETVREVHWCKMNAREILEPKGADLGGMVWPGGFIPIIPVLGDEIIVDGRRKISGLVRDAKDPQRQYNFMRSAVVEAVALAPKAPWMVAEGQDEDHEDEFQQANRRNLGVIHYKPQTIDNMMVPPPQRLAVNPAIEAMTIALGQSEHDIQATTNVYPAMLGAQGPEQSGKAIRLRQGQGEIGNSNWGDSLNRAIKACGRVVLDLIPHVYDTARVIRIVKPDKRTELVAINQLFNHQGAAKIHDLTVGNYDVTLSIGMQWESKRAEFVQNVLNLVQSAPQLMGVVGDLLVRNMDWPGAAEIADRLHSTLPQNLQDQNGQPPVPPQVQQQLQQLLASHAALVQQLQSQNETLRSKRLEIESAERIAALKAQTQILVAELASKDQSAVALLKADHAAIKHQIDTRSKLLHTAITVEDDAAGQQADQAHDAGMAAQQQEHDRSMAAGDQQHQQQMQQSDQQHQLELQQQQQAAAPAPDAQ